MHHSNEHDLIAGFLKWETYFSPFPSSCFMLNTFKFLLKCMHPLIREPYVKIYQMTWVFLFVCLFSGGKGTCMWICSTTPFEATALVVGPRSSSVTNLTYSDQRQTLFEEMQTQPCQGWYPPTGRKASRNMKGWLTLLSSQSEVSGLFISIASLKMYAFIFI